MSTSNGYYAGCPADTVRIVQGLSYDNPVAECYDKDNNMTVFTLNSDDIENNKCIGTNADLLYIYEETDKYECQNWSGNKLSTGKISSTKTNVDLTDAVQSDVDLTGAVELARPAGYGVGPPIRPNYVGSPQTTNLIGASLTNLINSGIPIVDAKFPLADANFTCNIVPSEMKVVCTGTNNNGDVMMTYELVQIASGPAPKFEITITPDLNNLNRKQLVNQNEEQLVTQYYVSDENDVKCQNGDIQYGGGYPDPDTGKITGVLCQRPNSSTYSVNLNGPDMAGYMAGFTSHVYEFKSRKGRNVERFSQKINNKCKARY